MTENPIYKRMISGGSPISGNPGFKQEWLLEIAGKTWPDFAALSTNMFVPKIVIVASKMEIEPTNVAIFQHEVTGVRDMVLLLNL